MCQKLKISIVLFIITFSIQSQNWGKNQKIKGNGKIVSEQRSTSTYDEISSGGSFDIILVNGKEGNLSILAEENIIPFIETNLEGTTLVIKFKKNTNIISSKKIIIRVPVKEISKISLAGSGNISNEGILKTTELTASLGGSGNIKLQISTKEMTVNIGGSGNIDLSGVTDEFICSVAGSGNVSAFELNSQNSNATVAGSGSIKLSASSKIKAKVVGSGNIYYKGNPTEKDEKSVGSGKIIHQN